MRTVSSLVLAALVLSIAAAPAETHPSRALATASPLVAENMHSGTADWRSAPSGDAIAGYASATSVNVGGAISFAVSTTSATYSMSIYRLGYYGGLGGRLLLSLAHLAGQNQGYWAPYTFGVQQCPSCRYDPTTGLITLNWRYTYTLQIPSGWISGDYLVKLSTPAGDIGYITFVVRDDARPSALLVVLPVNTYEAYNLWGGDSLYTIGRRGPHPHGQPRAFKVTFARPYDTTVLNPAGSTRDNDIGMIQFLEREGLDVTYATSVDVDRDPSLLLHHRAVVSIGHDEYWSHQMFTGALAARDAGVNLAFFGGNDVFWQVRYESDASGQDHRVLVCYKSPFLDPLKDRAHVTHVFKGIGLPESILVGTIAMNALLLQPRPWTVTSDAPSWLLAGTGLHAGSVVPNLLYEECDQLWGAFPSPKGIVIVGRGVVPTLTIVSHGVSYEGQCDSTYYVAPSGAQVFAASDEGWAYLIGQHAVAQMTLDILERFAQVRSSQRL